MEVSGIVKARQGRSIGRCFPVWRRGRGWKEEGGGCDFCASFPAGFYLLFSRPFFFYPLSSYSLSLLVVRLII